jgi:co-chaperonin GroES (HSP10)
VEFDPPRGTFLHGYPYWRRMRLIPHGFTILIEPDSAPEQTDSGLILMPQDRDHVATSGVVVAVGKGSKRLWEERQKALGKVQALLMEARLPLYTVSALERLFGASEPTPSVQVGDRVVFAAEAGLTVNDDGKDYILLEEDRIAIVVEEESEVA